MTTNENSAISLKGILQLFILKCITFLIVGSIVLHDCPPGPGIPETNLITVLNLSIGNCTEEPCVFEKKSTYESYVKAAFNLTANVANKFTYTATALIPGVPVVVSTDDLCEQLRMGACNNITPGFEMEARLSRRFSDLVPSFEGDLRFQIAKDAEPVFCGQLKISVKMRPVTTQGFKDGLSGLWGIGGNVGG